MNIIDLFEAYQSKHIPVIGRVVFNNNYTFCRSCRGCLVKSLCDSISGKCKPELTVNDLQLIKEKFPEYFI